MGEFTTLNLFAPYSKVIVASPEYEQGQGWGDVWKELPQWYSEGLDSWSIAKNIVDGYISYYTNNPPNQPLAYPQTIGLTAVKTQALSTLRESFEKFAGDLYQTANDTNQQLYNLFSTQLANEDYESMKTDVYWTNVDLTSYVVGEDEIADTLYKATAPDTYFPQGNGEYHIDYGGGLGGDLLFMVTFTGFSERVKELGKTSNFPEVNSNVSQDALSFLDTYNQVKNSDELYTKYLVLNMDGTVNSNVTGSGLSLIYPYTSPDYAQLPKLELCDYTNYTDTFKDLFPNYTGFVNTVFGELWKAVKDAGLEGNGQGQFTCDDLGNVVWNNQ